MGKQTPIHQLALTAVSTAELMTVYDDWAANYDQDLMEEWGYSAPERVAHFLKQYLRGAAGKVVDAGCGTGLVGQCLHDSGFAHIDGIDCSHAMLEQASGKQVYETLHCLDMNKPLPLTNAAYDGVTCVGTFTSAHVQPEALRELVRITRPGGVLSFTVRLEYWQATNFRELLVQLDTAGEACLEELRTEPYVESEGSLCKLVVLRVPG